MNPPRLLLTGPPGCGKTTLIERIACSLKRPFHGFYTADIREKGQRVGFEIESFAGAKAIMSHVDIRSPYRVGKYGVDLHAFESIAIPEIEAALKKKELLIIDELGKMELFSQSFKNFILDAFDSDVPLIAAILSGTHPFCDRLKRFAGVELFVLSRHNHDDIFRVITGKVT